MATTTFQEFSVYRSNERSTAFIANTPSYYDPNQNNDRNLYKPVSGPEGRTLHFRIFLSFSVLNNCICQSMQGLMIKFFSLFFCVSHQICFPSLFFVVYLTAEDELDYFVKPGNNPPHHQYFDLLNSSDRPYCVVAYLVAFLPMVSTTFPGIQLFL